MYPDKIICTCFCERTTKFHEKILFDGRVIMPPRQGH